MIQTKFPAVIILTALVLLMAISPASAKGEERLNLIDTIARELQKDKGFTPQERAAYLSEFRRQLGSYAWEYIRDANKQAAVKSLMRVVTEGTFDEQPVARVVEVAVIAYKAVNRGSPPEVAEGIVLYAFRKKLNADHITVWAHLYREMTAAGVPGEVTADLIYNAMENEWDLEASRIIGRGIESAQKEGLDVRKMAAYLIVNYNKTKSGPGSLFAEAIWMQRRGKLPKVDYDPIYYEPEKTTTTTTIKPTATTTSVRPTTSSSVETTTSTVKPGVTTTVKPTTSATTTSVKPKTTSIPSSTTSVKPEKPAPGSKVFFRGVGSSIDSFLGTPYVWGGETRKGADCSGFVQTVFRENGVSLPRVSRQQWTVGREVKQKDLRQGDLVFFNTSGSGVSHVGIYWNDNSGEFVHASSSKGVSFAKLSNRWFASRYLGARRIVENGRSLVFFRVKDLLACVFPVSFVKVSHFIELEHR